MKIFSFLFLLLVFPIQISAQTSEGLKIPERVNSSNQPLDINNKADELGITAEQLNGILNSVEKSSGEGGGDPLPDAMQERSFTGETAGDQYGYSVASAGDVNGDGYDDIVVGAPLSTSARGKVYLYFGGQVPNSIPDGIFWGGSVGGQFGFSVSSAGDVNADGFDDIIIGAPYEDGTAGRATIIFGNSTMTTYSVLSIFNLEPNYDDYLGISVSGAGDVNGDGYADFIVGASYHDHWGADMGNAYIYFGGSSMNATPDLQLVPDGPGSTSEFGRYVSAAGDVNGDGFSDVIVGAPADGVVNLFFGGAAMNNIADLMILGRNGSFAGDVNGDGYSDFIIGSYGEAYIYFGGTSININPDITLTGENLSDWFGNSVSGVGDLNGDGYSDVVVGAYLNDAGGTDAGRAYVYYGGAIMDNVKDVILTGAASGDLFGYSVATAGDVNGDGYSDLLIGAQLNDAGGSNAGRAYLYTNSLSGTDIPDEFFTVGYIVSTAGDVNGDGYADFIVGQYGGAGRAYIYFGGPDMSNAGDVILTGAAGDYFGYSVSTAGDVNGDGYADVIVGAYRNDAGGTDAGGAYIYFGGASMNELADVTLTGAAAGDYFGHSVSTAGDVNGDGYSDVIVGAYANDAGGSNAGRAYIYFGGSGIGNNANVILTGAAADFRLGISVSTAGDVNGDGYFDVIVGADLYKRAYIYFGGAGMDNTSDVIFIGEALSDYFGHSVSTAGDVNGDGYSDVIVGDHWNDTGGNAVGRAFIYFGGNVMDNTADVILTGEAAEDFFGISVSTAGDVNGDGYADVIVGAFENDAGGSLAGRAYIYFGKIEMDNTPDVILTGGAAWIGLGRSVSTAGDVNRDGYSDVIVGGDVSSRAYLYLSSSPPIKPPLKSVKDIPLDQGGYVRVRWNRSGYDIPGQNRIADYILQRSDPPGLTGFVWDYVVTVPAIKESEYSYVSPTPYDSMTNTSGAFYFRVIARGTNPEEMWYSNLKYGHSVDNLSPAAPFNFYANLNGSNVKLGWKANTEEDFKNYVVYRTDIPNANPDTLEVFAVVMDTTYIDNNPLAGTAYYFLRAQDIHNNLSQAVKDSILQQTTFSLSVAVTDGWNMVSAPGLHPTNQNVSTWWPNRNTLADVYRWTTTYDPVTLTAQTQGYWMLHTGAQTYNYPAIQIVAHDPIPLTAGWNMIGGYENTPLVSGLTTTPADLIVTGTVYGWTGTYTNPTNLVPGYGYWVLSTGNGVINPPTSADGPAKLVVQDDKSDWGKITITDASGKSYTLYSVNGEVNLDQYQMPPLPPAGMFDVRYSSNRKAENLKENNQTIEMRGLVYPVTVRAEKMDLKLQDETGKGINVNLKAGEDVVISDATIQKLMVSGESIPTVYALEQNYPNPFNPSTKIEFSIPEDVNNVTLTIYNALGQKVAELVNSKMEAGKYSYVWNASDVATGLYIYELRTDKFVSVKKMILLK